MLPESRSDGSLILNTSIYDSKATATHHYNSNKMICEISERFT